jgi:DNA-binding response OmpR family regulator
VAPIPRPLEEKERVVFETLAGSPLGTIAPTTPARVPALEEMHTILAVDDDESILRLMVQMLQSRKYRVLTALTGREALARVKEAMPDLAILDGMLPEVHGFEICRQLKTSERFRHIPVIMVSAVHTGWRFAADVKEKYGADDYLEKPFDPADLLRRVESLLTRTPAVAPDSEAAARQHLKEGVIALKQDRLDDAVAAFKRGLAIDQFNDMLHYYLAMTYDKKDMVFHAIDHYETAIKINGDFYDAITSLANLYQRQEFWRKAVEMWELALSATQDEAVRARIKDHLLSLL